MINPMSPEPRIATRRPGRHPCRLTRRWAKPAVKTPAGRDPGIRIAARVRSRAPIDNTAVFVSISFTAAVAEVSVSPAGQLKIHRIVAATDPGHAVNPMQIAHQIEGSFAYGLSACLYGECTVKDGRMEQQNFDTYPVMRMADMPAVESIVMPSGGFWGGVGEPTIAVAAPAVLNAVFAATGKRVRTLPLKHTDLRRA